LHWIESQLNCSFRSVGWYASINAFLGLLIVCATTVCIGMFGRHAVFFVLLLRSTGRFNSFQSPVPAVDSGDLVSLKLDTRRCGYLQNYR